MCCGASDQKECEENDCHCGKKRLIAGTKIRMEIVSQSLYLKAMDVLTISFVQPVIILGKKG
jgi:hypothetical protein